MLGIYFSFWMVEKPEDSVIVKLVVSLLQLSKMAVNHTGEKAVLGKLIRSTSKSWLSLQTPGWNCACSQCYFPLCFPLQHSCRIWRKEQGNRFWVFSNEHLISLVKNYFQNHFFGFFSVVVCFDKILCLESKWGAHWYTFLWKM